MSNPNMPDSATVRPLVRLVDDDVEFLRSQKFFLETFLPEVRTWESAETFLSEDNLTRPGCLVLDIRMSGMSGLELQRLLEMRRSTLRIIFLSAHGDIGTAVHAMRHGALDFLEKPVEPEVLLMDEPCSALDPIATQRVEESILELKQSLCIVIVTHNMQQAARVSDKTAFFFMGKLIEFDDTDTIFNNAANVRTRDYVNGRFG